MAKRDYLVEAAKQIRMALDSEVNEDYEAAFSYYKNGVDLLLNGVQLDPNKERREAVKRKTTQYLKRAEEIFITHLQDNLGKGSSHLGGYSSLRFRPIRHLSSPVEDLEMCKVVGVTDKNVLVNENFVHLLEVTCQEHPGLDVQYGGVGGFIAKKPPKHIDPMKVIQDYLDHRKLRLWDVFRNIDKDGTMRVPVADFRRAVQQSRIPLDRYQIEELIQRLDRDRTGMVDYRGLADTRKQPNPTCWPTPLALLWASPSLLRAFVPIQR